MASAAWGSACQVFPLWSYFFPPFSYSILWKQVPKYSPYWRGRELSFILWMRSIYINYLEFFGMGDLSLLPHLFIYSVIYLCQYRLMEIYFIFWVVTQYDIFIFCLNCSSFSHWELSRLAPVSFWHAHIVLFSISILSVIWNAPDSFYIFSAPAQESAISPKSTCSLTGEWYRKRDVGPWCACCYRNVIAPKLS